MIRARTARVPDRPGGVRSDADRSAGPAPRRALRLALTLAIAMAELLPLPGALGAQELAGPEQRADSAQVVPILTIDSDRFFGESAFGRRVAEEIESESAELAAENRRIEAQLTEQEQALTDRRSELPAEEFRPLADAFDTRVQRIRREQEAKARALAERAESDRVAFLRAARPVLGQLMREAGASVILERGSVFFSSNASDITDRAIERIDAAIGDGADAAPDGPLDLPPAPPEPAPDPAQGPVADPGTPSLHVAPVPQPESDPEPAE